MLGEAASAFFLSPSPLLPLSFSVVERILEETLSAPIWLHVWASSCSGDFSFFDSG